MEMAYAVKFISKRVLSLCNEKKRANNGAAFDYDICCHSGCYDSCVGRISDNQISSVWQRGSVDQVCRGFKETGTKILLLRCWQQQNN